MSVHKDCGEEIRWVHRQDDHDRYAPPLEFIGKVLIITEDNIAVEVSAYKKHNCDPEKMNAWLDYLDKIEKIKDRRGVSPESPPYESMREVSNQRAQETARNQANAYSCPTCLAEIGQNCVNLSKRARKEPDQDTRWPHPARMMKYQLDNPAPMPEREASPSGVREL